MPSERIIKQIERAYDPLPTPSQHRHYVNTICDEMKKVSMFLADFVPESRELSLALTSIEEACGWAIRGAAHKPPTQTIEPAGIASSARTGKPGT